MFLVLFVILKTKDFFMHIQNIKFTDIHAVILIKIIHEGQNTNIGQVSKVLFRLFDKAMEQKWKFFLEEEFVQKGSILTKIEERYTKHAFVLSKKEACSPGLRKFKFFFGSCSREMIQRAFICSSYPELLDLKTANDQSVCAMVQNIEDEYKANVKLTYKTAPNARRDLRFIEQKHSLKNKLLTCNLTFVLRSYDGKYFPPEFCHTFKNLKSLVLRGAPNLASLPPEIYLIKNLEKLEINRTAITCLPPEICQINLKCLIIDEDHSVSIPVEGLIKHKTLEKIVAREPSILCPFSKLSSIKTFLIADNKVEFIQVAYLAEKGEKLFVKGVGWKPTDFEQFFPLISEDVNIPLTLTNKADRWIVPLDAYYKFDTLVFKIVKTDEQGNNLVEEQGENRTYPIPDFADRSGWGFLKPNGSQWFWLDRTYGAWPGSWKIFIVPRF